MGTNKILVREVNEFMAGYKPIYTPIYPKFLGKSQSYSNEAGLINFKRVETVGDIRSGKLFPKDTEIKKLNFKESQKTFKKYFSGIQFDISDLQDQQGVDDVVSQVLDEHQKMADELFLQGEGTSASTMINNGLYWSDDANYKLNTTEAVTDAEDLMPLVMENVEQADTVAGRKLLLFYGADMLPVYDSLHTAMPIPFKKTLQELVPSYEIAKIPTSAIPSGENGFIIANLDQIKLHYAALPSLSKSGHNDEKGYSYYQFLMGSMMLDVLAGNGIVRQICTVS